MSAPAASPRPRRRPGWLWALAALAAALPLLFAAGLTRDPSHIPSALIGQPVPPFRLPALEREGEVGPADHAGQPLIVNFWASWCPPCRVEHPVLADLGARAAGGGFAMLGVNTRDDPRNALRFLLREGAFPYPSGLDPKGRLGIDFGTYGTPETFFIDAEGIVRARHPGPLEPAHLARYLPLIGVAP